MRDELEWLKDRLEYAVRENCLVDLDIEADQAYGLSPRLIACLLDLVKRACHAGEA